MKTIILLSLAYTFAAIGIEAAPPPAPPVLQVALRHVTAAHALAELQNQLGQPTVKAVLAFDEKRNMITLDPTNAESRVARAFLAGLDSAPIQARIEAKIRTQSKTSNSSKARAFPSRHSVIVDPDRPQLLRIPDPDGVTEIELSITPLSK